jgi:hypothetical protein
MAIAKNMSVTIVALAMSHFLTNGSLTRDQFIQVYSLKPRYAMTTSSLYWYETSKYAPRVNGRMTWWVVSILSGV